MNRDLPYERGRFRAQREAARAERDRYKAALDRIVGDLAGGGDGMKLRTDDYSEVVLDADGQGFVRVNDLRTHSMWACCMCGIPTGGSERRCQTHPDSGVFLKSIRERSPSDV